MLKKKRNLLKTKSQVNTNMCVSVQEGDAFLVHGQLALSRHVGDALQQSTKWRQPIAGILSASAAGIMKLEVMISKSSCSRFCLKMSVKPPHRAFLFTW